MILSKPSVIFRLILLKKYAARKTGWILCQLFSTSLIQLNAIFPALCAADIVSMMIHQLIQKAAQDVSSYLPTARRLILTGMGDPFARPDTRRLLMEFKSQNPDFAFDIVTNGLLLPRYWDHIKRQKFGSLLISVDASKRETYDKIRIGGSWDELMNSLALVQENKEKFSSVTLNMTVMRHNYGELPEFIDLAESYGFNVSFQRIRGKHKQNFFDVKDEKVIDELKTILEREQFSHRRMNIFWGDLVEFMKDNAKLKQVACQRRSICRRTDEMHLEENEATEVPVDSVVTKLQEDAPLSNDDGIGSEINLSKDDEMHLEENEATEVPVDSVVTKLQEDAPLSNDDGTGSEINLSKDEEIHSEKDEATEVTEDSIVTQLQTDAPLFHDDGTGSLITWFSNTNLLTALDKLLSPGMRTIETGSGYSTVVFLSRQCLHTCISPVKEEIERIKEYCSRTGISLESAEFMINESHDILPSYPGRDFDLFLP